MRECAKAEFAVRLSSEFAVRSPFLFFLCRLLAHSRERKKHFIAACLVTSKFKEANMTSSLSRFAQKKGKIMEIIMVPGVPCLPFWQYPVLPGTLTPYYLVPSTSYLPGIPTGRLASSRVKPKVLPGTRGEVPITALFLCRLLLPLLPHGSPKKQK